MSAFEKIRSGFPGMDQLLDHIRIGDNVVLSVGSLEEFRFFAVPFAQRALADGRNLVYMHFKGHERLLPPLEGMKTYTFDPDKGFESFTEAIYDRITLEGKEAFYVFDSLSSLQSVWYTDLMMGNFFCVTCPYLFRLDTVAYFPLLRGRHSFETIARIRDTTQVLLDVYTKDLIYLHPLKVWNRYSSRMFLPHSCIKAGCREDSSDFAPVTDGVALSRFYELLDEEASFRQDQNLDSYDRFFSAARLEYQQGRFAPETEELILQSTMTRDPKLQAMLREYFTPRDYFLLRDRMIGSGCIGGKACGMLLARKIVHTSLPDYRLYHEPHDSFYIGSDVYYTYIVANNCWEDRILQRRKEGYFTHAPVLKKALYSGTFPANIREKFRSVLDYFGQSPIIVRSSSLLEDSYGNAFAGKYESVFCVNQGTPEERLEAFEQAVRTVYASTMDVSALEYRQKQGLMDRDEQMAVLVQRVSGSYHGDYFFPSAAGVGFSYSMYRLTKDMDPSAGLLRIVTGLGTRAVDRTENDYPRLVNLDRPALSLYGSIAERHQFSQRSMDVLDTKHNELVTLPVDELIGELPVWFRRSVMERDYEAEDALRRMRRKGEVWFITCQKLLENRTFTDFVQRILHKLEEVYENPVDIEYAVNLDEKGDFVLNLLQCRPLYTGAKGTKVTLPELPEASIFFSLEDSSMGNTVRKPIRAVVQIDPIAYYSYPYALKPTVAEAVGKINRYYQKKGIKALLLAPGRLGTSSPELGVPVAFADISEFCGICEVSDDRAGYMPELSYGSHMFQDLVEADISYNAIWNDKRTLCYQPELFADLENLFPRICPEHEDLFEMFRVTEPENLFYWNDVLSGKAICGFGGETPTDL